METGKKIAFSTILVVLGLVMAWFCVELGMRWQQRRIAGSNRMDPGLFQYDLQLGWELVPGWVGRHRHHDYDVSYQVNRLGFRADTEAAESRPQPLVAVLGDSFTFGFGVGDDETFVHRLDQAVRPGGSVANFAVPGTSTDQQALLLEGRLVHFRPAVVLLVVYLGNDLVDIQRPFPVQASNGKPFFALGTEGLELQNVPVPRESRPVTDAQGELRRAILGDGDMDDADAIAARLGPAMALFQAIVDRMAGVCDEAGAELVLVLLPGRSYLERPDSLSAQYQEIVRARIVNRAKGQTPPVLDLASAMRERAEGRRTGWYFPNDGHLTPEGHRVVAELLQPALTERIAGQEAKFTTKEHERTQR